MTSVSKFPDLLPIHHALWQSFQSAFQKGQWGQAVLLLGPLHARMDLLAQRILGNIFCQRPKPTEPGPCGHCQSCCLLLVNEHPDLAPIPSDGPSGMVSIEKIRNLVERIYTTPVLGKNRAVIIYSADKMNTFASNALLKMLEEPPQNTYFFLVAEQSATIAPTILSRCQQWPLSSGPEEGSYWALAQWYAKDSGRGKVFQALPGFIENLHHLLDLKISIPSLAAEWSAFELRDVLWILYLLHAEMICCSFEGLRSSKNTMQGLETSPHALAQRLSLVNIFAQLDKIQGMMKALHTVTSINALLFLEDFLSGYLPYSN